MVAGVSSIGLLIVLKFLSDYHSSNRVACMHKEKSLRAKRKISLRFYCVDIVNFRNGNNLINIYMTYFNDK